MKVVWDNDRPTVTAKGLTSRGTCESMSPNLDRQRFVQTYPVCKLGVFEMQRQAAEAVAIRNQKKRDDIMAWLDNLS